MARTAWIASLFLIAGAAGLLAAAPADGRELPPVDTPRSLAVPMSCSTPLEMGGPTSCKDQNTWYEYAKADCAARGYTALTILGYPEACGTGLSRFVKYLCCS